MGGQAFLQGFNTVANQKMHQQQMELQKQYADAQLKSMETQQEMAKLKLGEYAGQLAFKERMPSMQANLFGARGGQMNSGAQGPLPEAPVSIDRGKLASILQEAARYGEDPNQLLTFMAMQDSTGQIRKIQESMAPKQIFNMGPEHSLVEYNPGAPDLNTSLTPQAPQPQQETQPQQTMQQPQSTKTALPPLGTEISGKTKQGRPIVKNPDGSISTERTITVTDPRINGGKPTNIPSMYGGKEVSEQEAIARVATAGGKDPETGEVLPGFNSIEEAVAAAQARSKELGNQYGGSEPQQSPEEMAKNGQSLENIYAQTTPMLEQAIPKPQGVAPLPMEQLAQPSPMDQPQPEAQPSGPSLQQRMTQQPGMAPMPVSQSSRIKVLAQTPPKGQKEGSKHPTSATEADVIGDFTQTYPDKMAMIQQTIGHIPNLTEIGQYFTPQEFSNVVNIRRLREDKRKEELAKMTGQNAAEIAIEGKKKQPLYLTEKEGQFYRFNNTTGLIEGVQDVTMPRDQAAKSGYRLLTSSQQDSVESFNNIEYKVKPQIQRIKELADALITSTGGMSAWQQGASLNFDALTRSGAPSTYKDPETGRTLSIGEVAQIYKSQVAVVQESFARIVGGLKGTATEGDVKRAAAAFTGLTDTKAMSASKFREIDDRLDDVKRGAIANVFGGQAIGAKPKKKASGAEADTDFLSMLTPDVREKYLKKSPEEQSKYKRLYLEKMQKRLGGQ